MPFVDSSRSVRSKLHLSQVSPPLVAGVAALALVVVALAVFNVARLAGGEEFSVNARSGLSASDSGSGGQAEAGASSSQAATVFVYLSGCVGKPGVYEVAEGARVAQVLDLAGGFTEQAATDSVNLARAVSDGEQIDVPSVEEAALAQTNAQSGAGATATGGGAGGSSAAGTSASTAGSLVNLNSATQAELESLPGVGPAIAAKIIASREEEGPFTRKEDLKRVSGIGDKKYNALEAYICI